MTRILATLGFALSLLCPIFCLAGDGDCLACSACSDCADCSDSGPQTGRNCEAMTVGAVVESEVSAEAPQGQPSRWWDRVIALRPPPLGVPERAWAVGPNRSGAPPPPAATRQALLQRFLF